MTEPSEALKASETESAGGPPNPPALPFSVTIAVPPIDPLMSSDLQGLFNEVFSRLGVIENHLAIQTILAPLTQTLQMAKQTGRVPPRGMEKFVYQLTQVNIALQLQMIEQQVSVYEQQPDAAPYVAEMRRAHGLMQAAMQKLTELVAQGGDGGSRIIIPR